MGAEEPARCRIAGWAAIVCAATIVVAIGGPLIGRGLLIGSDIVRTVPPWDADTPTSFVYRHAGINDTIDAGAPAREAIRRTLVDDHRLPLWDPYPNGGAPLGSVPNSGTLAPINWPLLLLGVSHGLAWAAFLRLAVAAVGMFFLLRRLGVSRFAGVCGGLIYCTSGFLIVWNNYPQADIAAMVPLLFLAADVLRERRRAINVLAVAAVVAAMILEGYLPLLVVVLYALGAFLVVRWWDASGGRDPDRPSLSSRLRAAITPGVLLIAAFVLGATLVAFQLVPLLRGVDAYDITYRQNNANRLVPPAALLTSAFPWAQGSPAHPTTLAVLNPEVRRFTVNFVEQFAFLGAAAVVMALWALVRGSPSRVGRGVYGYCVGGAALLLLVLFGSSVGPIPDIGAGVTDALYLLPGINQVPIMRFMALLLFLGAIIAAFGVEHLVATESRPLRLDTGLLLRIGAVLLVLTYLAYRPVRDEITLLVSRKSTDYWGSTLIHVAGQRSWILRNSVAPALIALAAVAVIVVAWRWRGRARTTALVTLPVLFAIEGLLVTTPMLPRVSESEYFPQTGVTRYLAAQLDHERVAPAGTGMLYYATNPMYRIRSVSGHSFTEANWQQLIYATRPEYQLMLQNRLGQSLSVATSPILDRLGARFFVAYPTAVPFGTPQAAPPATGSVTVGNGRRAIGAVAPGPLRAIQVQLLGRERWRGDLVYLDVAVHDPSGKVLARGSRRLIDQSATTTYYVAMTGESLPAATPLQAEFRLRSDGRDTARLAATAAGTVSLGVIRPAADGLRITYADAGAVVYRRLHALSRIRWASQATVKDPDQTYLALLGGTVPPDTVILAQPGPAATRAPANVVVRRDAGDQIRIQVDAKGAGYLVVADAIQTGWQARLDGRPAALRKADHALVAIHVPQGTHTIELVARPRGWRMGIALSLTAIAIFVGLLAWIVIRRRRRARSVPSATPGQGLPNPSRSNRPEAPDPVPSST